MIVMDESQEKKSAHDRLVENYFATTSGVSFESGSAEYEKRTSGLRRGLGNWLDVAGKEVVDLGCGTGDLCWLADNCGARTVVGVNLSQDEIQMAEKYINAKFVCQDILLFLRERPTESVDRIFALNILEHLNRDTLVAVLEEARRCLTKSGSLVAMVPNATSPYGAMTRYWDFTHLLAFTPSSVRQIQRLCGFDISEFREWGPRPHGILSFARYVLWQIIRGFTLFRMLVETGSGNGGVYTADMIFRLIKR
jgi:SAM-dependent methyltransferase